MRGSLGMITIIDYDLGNVGSIKNMLEFLGFDDVEISSSKDRILSSTHVILPGVGSFDEGMRNLESRGLDIIIKEYANVLKKPILGICLGMQLLGNSSEEGSKAGLGLIDFINVKFKNQTGYKVPHMGWNYIKIKQATNPILAGIDEEYRYYFVHSFHAKCSNQESVFLTTDYGYEFPVGISKQNIYGVQFHPEKSHHFGMKLLENFLRIKSNE